MWIGREGVILEAIKRTGGRLNSPATESSIRAFEKDHEIRLPDEYRDFILKVGNGGCFGPECGGILPLGILPRHWRDLYAYESSARRPFPLSEEWVWEDETESPSTSERLARVDDGVLLLGEEGCGARWVLVVTGTCKGEVWLATGEGTAPCTPRMDFQSWLDRMLSSERRWWPDLVRHWGEREGVWFASHVAKQLAVENVEEGNREFVALAQAAPLCFDCQSFLAALARHEGKGIYIRTPDSDWAFGLDGSARSTPRGIAEVR